MSFTLLTKLFQTIPFLTPLPCTTTSQMAYSLMLSNTIDPLCVALDSYLCYKTGWAALYGIGNCQLYLPQRFLPRFLRTIDSTGMSYDEKAKREVNNTFIGIVLFCAPFGLSLLCGGVSSFFSWRRMSHRLVSGEHYLPAFLHKRL